MSSWWKRFFGLGEESDDEPIHPSSNEKIGQNSSTKRSNPSQSKGRLEDPHRIFEVKLIRRSTDQDSGLFGNSYRTKNQSHPIRFEKEEQLGTASFRKREAVRKPENAHHEMDRKTPNQPKEPTQNAPVKRRFAVSTVPSPIYGYNKRPSVHFERPQKTVSDEPSFMGHTMKTENRSEFDQVTTPPEEGSFVQEVKNEGIPEPVPVDCEEPQEPAHSSILEQVVDPTKTEEAPQNAIPIEASETADLGHDQENADSRMEPSLRGPEQDRVKEPPRKSAIPYNVMMYQSDRRRSATTPNSQSLRAFSLGLLNDVAPVASLDDDLWIEEKRELLSESLQNFNVKADVVGYTKGPTVTRFEIRLHPGVKVNKVVSLTEDLKLTLSAKQIRIAPITGKNTVGIEIPNAHRLPVHLKALLQSEPYAKSYSPLTAVLGQDLTGQHIVTDLAKMPHGLIAGATGSGKSVCIHSLILSLIYKATPDELRFILIDPKVVELAAYREMPHLAAPVITQPREASLALKWAVDEMENRYQVFAETGVRDLSRYNELVQSGKINGEKLPYLVIVIDELADLMMTSPQEVEAAICRIAQKARAAGIHMLLATQRPSVDVITGLIKSNIPTRIAFSVSSQADSRTILDMSGAERLLGQGDLLFSENGSRSLLRLQGTFITDEEIERVTETFGTQARPEFLFHAGDLQDKPSWDQEEDELFEEAAQFVIEQGQASVSSLQRRFRIGYNRAARLVDQLEAASVISESNGSKPRQVLMDLQTFENDL